MAWEQTSAFLGTGFPYTTRTLGPEIQAFLNHLAVDRQVSASTQNQALAAILFLFKEVLAVELPWLGDLVRAKRPTRVPVVPSRDEVRRVLHESDRTRGYPGVLLPPALERKYPAAPQEWGWQFLLPARSLCKSPYTGRLVRHHIQPNSVQRAVLAAVVESKAQSIDVGQSPVATGSPWITGMLIEKTGASAPGLRSPMPPLER